MGWWTPSCITRGSFYPLRVGWRVVRSSSQGYVSRWQIWWARDRRQYRQRHTVLLTIHGFAFNADMRCRSQSMGSPSTPTRSVAHDPGLAFNADTWCCSQSARSRSTPTCGVMIHGFAFDADTWCRSQSVRSLSTLTCCFRCQQHMGCSRNGWLTMLCRGVDVEQTRGRRRPPADLTRGM